MLGSFFSTCIKVGFEPYAEAMPLQAVQVLP